jgi:hypothetical protein
MYSGYEPRMRVAANDDVNVAGTQVVASGSADEWVTIGPLSITPDADGAVKVILDAPYSGVGGQTNWDQFSWT